MPPGTPLSPNIHALLLCLHHSHHVGFERLSRLMAELFGLRIAQGAIANAFRRLADPLETARAAIAGALREAKVVASDGEEGQKSNRWIDFPTNATRLDGITHWHWVFVPDRPCCTKSRRARQGGGRAGAGPAPARGLDLRRSSRPAG